MDDRKDVVAARPGERFEHDRVGDTLIGGPPWIDRIADVAERWQLRLDRRTGSLRYRRKVGADVLGDVGDERRLAGRHRDDPGSAATDVSSETPAAGVQLGRLEQGIEVGAADDAGCGQGRVGRPHLAGQ